MRAGRRVVFPAAAPPSAAASTAAMAPPSGPEPELAWVPASPPVLLSLSPSPIVPTQDATPSKSAPASGRVGDGWFGLCMSGCVGAVHGRAAQRLRRHGVEDGSARLHARR